MANKWTPIHFRFVRFRSVRSSRRIVRDYRELSTYELETLNYSDITAVF